MLLDNENLFSDSQAITTGTIYSTNTVYFGKNDVSFIPVIIQATSDFSNLTSLIVTFETSADDSFESSSELMSSSLKLDELKEGAKFPISYLPRGNKGYMRIKYTVVGTAETTGKITAAVVAGDGLEIQEI